MRQKMALRINEMRAVRTLCAPVVLHQRSRNMIFRIFKLPMVIKYQITVAPTSDAA